MIPEHKPNPNSTSQQAQDVAEQSGGEVSKNEANADNPHLQAQGLTEGHKVVRAAVVTAAATAVLFAGTGKALNFAAGKLESRFVKHAVEFGFTTESEYLAGASALAGEAAVGANGVVTKLRGTDTLIYKAATMNLRP